MVLCLTERHKCVVCSVHAYQLQEAEDGSMSAVKICQIIQHFPSHQGFHWGVCACNLICLFFLSSKHIIFSFETNSGERGLPQFSFGSKIS